MASACNRQLITRLFHNCHRINTKRLALRTFFTRLTSCLHGKQTILFTRTFLAKKCSICRTCLSQSAGSSFTDIDNCNKEVSVGHGSKNQPRWQKNGEQNTDLHIPVLKNEVLSYFEGKTGQVTILLLKHPCSPTRLYAVVWPTSNSHLEIPKKW